MALSLKTLLGAAVAAAAVLAATASAATGAAAAPSVDSCITPYNARLLGRTFTVASNGECASASRRPSTYVTLTVGSIAYDELTPAGGQLRTTVLRYGRAWSTPTITTVEGSRGARGKRVTAAPWGPTNRRAFVASLSRMVRGVEAVLMDWFSVSMLGVVAICLYVDSRDEAA
ncbi:hypothetical protein MMPV_006658 [Pyropia vietnamensis]